MDPRHEPIEQEILNELISLINNYIQDNTDEVIAKDKLRDDIKHIANFIYAYAHMRIDLEGIVSKRNFLSNDMILLPHIDEIVNVKKVTEDDETFRNTVKEIKKILRRHGNGGVSNRDLHHSIGLVLSEFSG